MKSSSQHQKKHSNGEDKEEIKEINLSGSTLEKKGFKINRGRLDLSEYVNLENIEIDGTELKEQKRKIKGLILGSKPKLKRIYCPNNSLDKLDLTNCPNLEVVNCEGNKIKELNLGRLEKLIKLDCESNGIEELNLQNCPNLKELRLPYNYLTNLDLSQNAKIETLNIRNNNFLEQDLSFLKNLVNLKLLWIDNFDNSEDSKERIEKGIYNKFTGSLEHLASMKKLKDFRFSSTDLDSGLEYLPSSLQTLECATDCRENAKVKSIEQELRNFGKPDSSRNFVHLLPIWEEFNSQARKWLDKNYPQDGVCQRETEVWNNKGKSRAEITELDISEQDLEKGLELKGFIGLKKLNCTNNQLTNLNLNDCPNLVNLDCSHNKLCSLDFLKTVGGLEKLWLQNNQELLVKNLNFLTPLVELKELNVSDSTLRGSLKPLENLNKLEKLFVSRTNITEGLECLPENCKEIYCDLDYHSGSVEIAKELSKFSEGEEENHTKYNLDKWRKDKANNLVSSIIPLERIFVIKSNIKYFLNKWGKKERSNSSELSNLQSPKEFNKYWYVGGAKWIARAGAVTGGILALTDNPVLGGTFATTFPFMEVVSSQMEEKFYNAKKEKWEEFINDTESLLDNYHELLGILEQIKKSELGTVNQALNNLRDKVNKFLDAYDGVGENEEEKNGIVGISELIGKQKEFGKDLSKEDKEKGGGSQLGDIVLAMKELEKEVTNYRQRNSQTGEEQNNHQQEIKEDADSFILTMWRYLDEEHDQENNSQIESATDITDNNSSSAFLNKKETAKDRKILLGAKNFLTTNLTTIRKKLTHSQMNNNDESYELQNQEQVAQTLHVPSNRSSSSK